MQSNVSKIYNKLSPELRLVLLCSSLKSKDKDQGTIDKLIASEINWSIFTNLVVHHRVYPLVYRYLSTLAYPAVPNEVMSTLCQINKDNKCKTLQMIAEFIKILRALEQSGIRVIVIKGFPLAYQLYGDITLRTSRDIDILVNPEEIYKAREIIEKHGYIWDHALASATNSRFNKWMEIEKHIEYWHPGLETCIELHWRLDILGMDLPHSLIEDSKESLQLLGQSIQVLGKEESLMYLTIHGAAHAWFRVKWLLDIDIIIRKGDFSWGKLFQMAHSLGAKAVLHQVMILLRELLDTPLPKFLTDAIENDTRAQHLASMALRHITDSHGMIDKTLKEKIYFIFRLKLYQQRLKSGWRNHMFYFSKCFLPSDEDFRLISLSDRMYFFYYIISPMTWFYRRTHNVIKKFIVRG